MKTLKLAKDLALPLLEAVTQTFAILGRRGSGKTTTATVLVEEFLAAGQHTVVLDPLDVTWGLRASRDGKKAGFPITVVGGDHADLPLEASAGAVIAEFVVEHHAPLILSLRHFSMNDQRRFVTDFCERLYGLKGRQEHRTALHVVIDEADEFAPQRILSGHERMFGAIDRIVRRGRASGLGVTLISQRAAVIHKDVLSQAEVLICHQTISPQDRKALEAWIDAHDAHGQAEAFMASLASLQRGEAWVWSPGWLDVFQRVQVRDRTTFDSSATPKAGQAAAAPKQLAAVDLAHLQERMAATIEKAKAEDPRELRKQVADLKRQLAEAQPVESSKRHEPRTEIRTIEVPVVTDKLAARLDQTIARLERMAGTIKETGELLGTLARDLRADLAKAVAATSATRVPGWVTIGHGSIGNRPPAPRPRSTPAPTPNQRRVVAADGDALTGPEQRILDAVAWLEAIGVTEPEQPAVAFLAGYTYGAGGFNNPRSRLNQRGFVQYLPGDRIRLTTEGRTYAAAPAVPLSVKELHARVLDRLPTPEQRVLRPLLEAYPNPIEQDELARRAGYAPGTGGFNNPRGRLRTLGLIEYPQPGFAVAKPLLFLEGAA